jgi:hypothetical protein
MRRLLYACTAGVLFALAAFGQRPPDRLAARIDSRKMVTLRGTRSPRIDGLADQGPVEDTARITGLGFRFRPSAAQQAELEKLLDDQQNPNSPLYHAWLTPEKYGVRFGLSENDLAKVTDWLATQGFQVDTVARSRTYVIFSGTAGQVRDAFRTELHRFRADGEAHYANVSDISVPVDLAQLIYTVRGLNSFRIKPKVRLKPLWTTKDGSHYVAPADMATIYNLNPLYQKGIDGSGQKIVVAGQSGFSMSDVESFRSWYGLPNNNPKVIPVLPLPDPVINDDLDEALIDVEWAGASAPNATILFVVSQNVFFAAEYAVDGNLAPVISYSYGNCELAYANYQDELAQNRSLAQQANAQGITWVASSGDAGAADCETQLQDTAGLSGMTVDVPAALPEVTGVGGTEFSEGSGNYWSKTAPNGSSVISYIPEVAWNETAAGNGLAATGGGASSSFAKPAWQTGPGVPADNARHVPDVAFNASWDHDGYLIVVNGDQLSGGGTSAATPFFAGILSLLNQQLVTSGAQVQPGLGNINPKLYQLAQSNPSAFHDVTAGDNIVPCEAGSPDCTTGSYGYKAGRGYDPVTGLGSVDADAFVTAWSSGGSATPSTISTTTTATAAPDTIAPIGSTVVKATVTAASGTVSPDGPVYFSLGETQLGSANLSGSGGVATTSLKVNGSQLAAGANTITVWYGGSHDFLSSTGTVVVTVPGSGPDPGQGSAVTATVQPSPVYQQALDADGYAWFYTLRLTETAGVATKLTGFTIDGSDYSAQIPAFFGGANLAANATLSASLRAKNMAIPADLLYVFTGVDPSGKQWKQQLTVSFRGPQTSASIDLSSAPTTVLRSPKGNPNCDATHPFYQQLNLQEKNGHEVRLTKFLAAGNDFTSQIAGWFGSQRLAAYGTLHANICWTVDYVPYLFDFEVDGVDDGGKTVAAKLQVQFQDAATNPGALAVSMDSIALTPAVSGSASATLMVNVPASEQWNVTMFPANQTTRWLTVAPLSGRGPGQMSVSASGVGLPNGVYTATLVVQSLNTVPQFVNVPVTFTIGDVSSGH